MSVTSLASADQFTDLVMAILAVNGWNLEKVGALLPAMKKEGLTNPSIIANRSYGENARSLESAGYSRGEYMVSMLTDRIISAAQTWVNSNLEVLLPEAEQQRNRNQITELLSPIKGVGKMVISNYLLLRGFN